MNKTPASNRIHIGIFGRTNVGKSSLLNRLADQEVALVSPKKGTTTDPINKAMEIHGLGPVVFIDTAGFNDREEGLGQLRVASSRKVLERIDQAILVIDGPLDQEEKAWLARFEKDEINYFLVLNKGDLKPDRRAIEKSLEGLKNQRLIEVSALKNQGIDLVLEELKTSLKDFYQRDIFEEKSLENKIYVLVMPQDKAAPKGRLILPQVQVIRELIDKKAVVVSTVVENLDFALKNIARRPDLVIVDSKVFKEVDEILDEDIRLTSFSILFARLKGDENYFKEGARSLKNLDASSRVLIAEACSHAPIEEDIGTVKIPRFLKEAYGIEGIDFTRGRDFPLDLRSYDLIIHCGACMFNRRQMVTRIERARSQGVAMTNYGMTLAYLEGILDRID